MKSVHFILIINILLCSCVSRDDGRIMEVTVEMGINERMPIAEITEELSKIDLEMTDESIINPNQIQKVLLSDSLVFISESDKLLLFAINGRFVRSIGSKGRGPGEYHSVRNFAVDETNKIVYITDSKSIICYSWNGEFIKQITLNHLGLGQILGFHCFKDELLLLTESLIKGQIESNDRLICFRSMIYILNSVIYCAIEKLKFEC